MLKITNGKEKKGPGDAVEEDQLPEGNRQQPPLYSKSNYCHVFLFVFVSLLPPLDLETLKRQALGHIHLCTLRVWNIKGTRYMSK